MAEYMTYKQYQRTRVKQLQQEHNCSREDALLCVDKDRWYRDVIQPAMAEGKRPSIAVLRSMLAAGWTHRWLCREFLTLTGRDDFWPLYYDTNGKKIEREWSTRVRRSSRKTT